jgi:nitronate monooxygenase
MTDRLSGHTLHGDQHPLCSQKRHTAELARTLLNRNRKLKKYAKMLTFYKGMKLLEKAAFSTTYKTVWCAGPSIAYVRRSRL